MKKKDKLVCHVCAFKMNSHEVKGNCQRCGTDLQNTEKEQLQKKGVGFLFQKRLSQKSCALLLTNRRLFLVVAPKEKFFGSKGFIGGLNTAIELNNGGGLKELEFNLLLESIEDVSIKKTMFSKYITIKSKDNEEYKLNMIGIGNLRAHEEWRAAIVQEAPIKTKESVTI